MDSLKFQSSFTSHSFASTNSITKPLCACHLSFFRLTCINRFKSSAISISHQSPSNSLNPIPESKKNRSCRLKPLCFLLPIVRKMKGLAWSQSRKLASRFRSYIDDTASFSERHVGDYAQNGGFGVALLSVTASAKVKISPFVATLAANPTFVSGLFALFVAQSMKMFLNFFVERKWDFRILFASGGMPSSHSALCMALTTSVALCHGVADSLFPVCFGFSLIVMYDAIGVRRHAGMQAEVLNLIIKDLCQGHPVSQRKLKELLGHTPSQVLAGALLGILVACVCCQGCFAAT